MFPSETSANLSEGFSSHKRQPAAINQRRTLPLSDHPMPKQPDVPIQQIPC
jgi:hypothetical protein